MPKISKNIIVFYHESCLDGFASAYTAWKKFKNKALYIPLSYNATREDILKDKKVKISDLKEKQVYFIDFCLNEVEIKKVEKVAKKLIVIDHHLSKKDLVESLPNSLFRVGVSGAYLAHEYFFPKKPIPKLIQYISIGDTYTWQDEEKERIVLAYISTLDFDFKVFVKAEKDLENKKEFLEIKKIGKILQSNYLKLVSNQINSARLINFEGYKVYAINASSTFKNELGHILAQKSKDLFSIVYTFENGELKISLRGEGKTDLSKLAKKYNGGGHFNAASFRTKDKKCILDFIDKIIS